ncbi:MAG: hypothetical protein ACMUHM_06710 [Thermoplasmatota archaeon]
MAEGSSTGMRIASILALSLGPFLVMADIAAVVIVKHRIMLGFGTPGQVFPSVLGITGTVLWLGGLFFLYWAKRTRKGAFSSKARPVFLKGRNGFECRNCGDHIDASSVEYHERITCSCGKNYDVFQEGPWDGEAPTSEEGASPSRAPRMPRGNDQRMRKLPRRPSR